MVDAMVLGGLRRCEVLGLRLEDNRLAERRVFVAEGKGDRQRLIPVSGRFFSSLARYLDHRRPSWTAGRMAKIRPQRHRRWRTPGWSYDWRKGGPLLLAKPAQGGPTSLAGDIHKAFAVQRGASRS